MSQPGPKVLCTIAQLSDIVVQVAGEEASVFTLIGGDLDPHSYQLVKGDDETLVVADAIFACGLSLEHGPSLRAFLHSSPKVTLLGDTLLQEGAFEPILVDGQLDPHLWLDASIWAHVPHKVAKALAKVDPQHAALYQQRAQQLEEELRQLDQELWHAFQSIPPERRYLVTSHDAFNYMTRRYLAEPGEPVDQWTERLCAPEGLAPEGQLGIADLLRVIEFCELHQVHVLFTESNLNPAALCKIQEAGLSRGLHLTVSSQPLYGDSMGAIWSCGHPKSYQRMMRENQRTIVDGWSSAAGETQELIPSESAPNGVNL